MKENENEKLLLRIPVQDKDLVNTPNWISKFVITKGNEKGNFRMDTDAETNEGLLYVSKVSPMSRQHPSRTLFFTVSGGGRSIYPCVSSL